MFTKGLPAHANWNDPRYWERMDTSIGDKSRMLARLGRVKDLNVLEIGFGEAALLDILHREGANVHGIDLNREMVKKASKKPYATRVFHGSSRDIPALFPNKHFDVIILCSVVHEIYSYGEGMDSVEQMIDLAAECLLPGGVLLIRDGVEPEDGDREVVLQLSDAWSKRASYYLDLQPFGKDYSMESQGGGEWLGTLRAATAMLYTINWGMEALDRESMELNQISTEKGFREIVEKYGFIVETETYFNADYERFLLDDACLRTVDGVKLPYPDTNIVVRAVLD